LSFYGLGTLFYHGILKVILCLFIPFFGLTSCGILTTSTSNVTNLNTNVELSRKNFVVVANVTGSVNHVYLFGIGGLIGGNNLGKAYREMEKKANLKGTSRVIVNVTYDRYSQWIFVFERSRTTASGTVIEFIDDDYPSNGDNSRPTRRQQYSSNDDDDMTVAEDQTANTAKSKMDNFFRPNRKGNNRAATSDDNYDERTSTNANRKSYSSNVSSSRRNMDAPPCAVTYENSTVNGKMLTVRWTTSSSPDCGTPTAAYLQVRSPDSNNFRIIKSLPGTATSASFDYTSWVSSDNHVYARIVVENDSGATKSIIKGFRVY